MSKVSVIPSSRNIERCINLAPRELGYYKNALAELALLRTDLATAQRERDEARAQLAQADALAMTDTLAPRRCVTCAQEAAREMRDNAESICRDWNRAPYLVGSHFGGDSIPFAMRFHLADAIAALPLPSCDGCNPLEPEAENEATR